MFWIVEYDNGYCRDYENECHLDICKKYFLSEENALKFYNYTKNRLSKITDSGFENVELYCEFFYDENINILTQEWYYHYDEVEQTYNFYKEQLEKLLE